MLEKIIEFAISQLAARMRRQVATAVVDAVTQGIRDGFSEAGIELPADPAIPTQEQIPETAKLTGPTTPLTPEAPAPRKRGRPRKYVEYAEDNES